MAATKIYSTIGCCGIDCGLCPSFYTKGSSVCPGCGGLHFKDKHPTCSFHTCCAIKKGFEVCSQCSEYPCKKFDAERQGYDSFVTHHKVFSNLDTIKENGIEFFIHQQKTRMSILEKLLTNFDDGRSKSFFCISCALLPINILEQAGIEMANLNHMNEVKDKNKLIKEFLTKAAREMGIELKLNKKSG